MKNVLIALLSVSVWVTAFAENKATSSDGFRALFVGLSDSSSIPKTPIGT